jgi:hypothetical protein
MLGIRPFFVKVVIFSKSSIPIYRYLPIVNGLKGCIKMIDAVRNKIIEQRSPHSLVGYGAVVDSGTD